MTTSAPAAVADPRPTIVPEGDGFVLAGGRCDTCGHALAFARPRCPRCGGPVSAARFGPGGVVWAVTVVHVPAFEGDVVPYTLAYVDVDDGPRLLARLSSSARVGSRVELAAPVDGNPVADVVG